jgi:hypothetical protein
MLLVLFIACGPENLFVTDTHHGPRRPQEREWLPLIVGGPPKDVLHASMRFNTINRESYEWRGFLLGVGCGRGPHNNYQISTYHPPAPD